MLKKVSAILLVLIIMTVSSVAAFAYPTDDGSSTTQPAINSGFQQNGSYIGEAITSNDDITSEDAVTSESAITTESAITSESAIDAESAITTKKQDFEKVFNSVLEDGMAVNNGQFNMTITSPDEDKNSTYMKSYVLSGNSKYNDVVISIAKYNEDTNKYEPMYNTDGESSWEIGDFRLFSKEIILAKGINKIKIISHRTSQMEEALLENIQVNCFTIELLNDSIIKKVIRKTTEFGNDISKSIGDFLNKTK